jgi:S-adenosyl methyltransferase
VCAVTDNPENPDDHRRPDFDIDTRVASPARLYNFLAGGKGNFDVDRKTAEQVADGMPGGLDTIRAAVHALGDFTARAVRYLVEEADTRQFLYVGMPVPVGDPVHRIAQRVAPDARVVYVGNDPVVMAFAHRLKEGSPEGAANYVHGTLRAPDLIWQDAAETLDLALPVAILIPMTLCLVPDQAEPHAITAKLLDAVPSGSHLMLAHPTGDLPAEGRLTMSERLNEALPASYTVRTVEEVTRFFDGLDLVDPGLVRIDRWRPDASGPELVNPFPMDGAVGTKP